MRCIRVAVADRHPIVLQGLSCVLGAQRDFRVVARCGDAGSCIEAIRTFVPDIAILDVSMLDASGPKILAIANSEKLPTRFVFFAACVEDRHLRMLDAAGAYAVVSQDVNPETLVRILRQVADGRRPLSLPLTDLVASPEQGEISEKVLKGLTDRERQIIRLVSEGLSNKEIGRRLKITDGTIKVHLHHVFQKLDISNRTALAALAVSKDDSGNPS
jgi:two-component system, NarL family, nitrate/nitrite response regulator NarL